MHIKQTVLMFLLLILSVGNFLNAGDCYSVDVLVDGSPHKLDCKLVKSLDEVLDKFGLSQWGNLQIKQNGNSIPLEKLCEVKVEQCDSISITTEKS